MATAKLIPAIPVQQDVELRLSPGEADVLANILGMVSTGGPHGGHATQVIDALASVGYQSDAFATWKTGGISLK
jgi:hypothetical protein